MQDFQKRLCSACVADEGMPRCPILGPVSHPETIGAYRILGVVGEDGMGTVYRGQHRSAEVDRLCQEQ